MVVVSSPCTSPRQVLQNDDMAEVGGVVEGLPAIVVRRACLRPSPRQMLHEKDVPPLRGSLERSETGDAARAALCPEAREVLRTGEVAYSRGVLQRPRATDIGVGVRYCFKARPAVGVGVGY